VEIEKEVPLDFVLGKASWKELLGEIGARLDTNSKNAESALGLLQGIAGSIESRMVPARASHSSNVGCVTAAILPEKIRIWMIGPLRGQYEGLVERLKNFPFKFLGCQDKDKSPNAVSIPSSADWVLSDTRFISHSWRDTIQNQVGKDKLIECDGIRAIENWLRMKAGKIGL
jgi:hypothetical protein